MSDINTVKIEDLDDVIKTFVNSTNISNKKYDSHSLKIYHTIYFIYLQFRFIPLDCFEQ